MKLIMHLGLHKTGSTFLQYLANMNHVHLRERGIYYHPVQGYPAHHAIAWSILRRNFEIVLDVIQSAKEAKCDTILLSSEDLESLLFRPVIFTDLLKYLKKNSIGGVTVCIVIRRQDETFWSCYNEFSKHTFVDPYNMFYNVLNHGYYFIDNPKPSNPTTPFWYFSFAHFKNVISFVNKIDVGLTDLEFKIFEFENFATFPGDKMYDFLGIMPSLKIFPSEQMKNVSLPTQICNDKFMDQFSKVCGARATESLKLIIENRITLPHGQKKILSETLMDHFGSENDALIQYFSPKKP